MASQETFSNFVNRCNNLLVPKGTKEVKKWEANGPQQYTINIRCNCPDCGQQVDFFKGPVYRSEAGPVGTSSVPPFRCEYCEEEKGTIDLLDFSY